MAEKIKKASPYFLILVLVGLVIAFNFWSSLDKNLWNRFVEADTPDTGDVGSSVSVGNIAPTIHTVNVYGANMTDGIVLIENTGIDLMATITINDVNGCFDVQDVEAWFLTSDELWDHTTGNNGTSCDYDENNCYDNTVVSCSYDSCAGTEATFYCVASVAGDGSGGWRYFADATSKTEDQASKTEDEWIVVVYASDSAGNDVTSDSWLASDSANVNLYSAIDVEAGGSDSIPYGQDITPGNTTKAPQIGIRNTGNRGVDPIIEEVGSMSLDGQDDATGVINTWRQQYATFDFNVNTEGTSLSGDNLTTAFDLNLPQRGDGDDPYTSVSDDQFYFGIDVPMGQHPGDYKGSVQYTTVAD